jgi:hypothetical protein
MEDKAVKDASKAPAKRTTIVGEAKDAKLGAAVVSANGSVVYCIEMSEWPPNVLDKWVEVVGVLNRTDQFRARVDKDGAISQGTAGGDLLMRDVTYKIVAAPE